MPKLTCGLTKHVADPEHGSRTASVSLEVELEAAVLREPDKLKQHIRCGFDRIREAIDEELARSGALSQRPDDPSHRHGQSRRADRPATASQLRLLRVLAGRGGVDLQNLIRELCHRDDRSELRFDEASRLIDELSETRSERR